MRKIYSILFVFTFLASGISMAQDSHISQYYASPLYLNPANAGMYNGKYRAHLHTRSQWNNVVKNPFFTHMLSFDMPLSLDRSSNFMSAGAFISDSRAGRGQFNVFNFNLTGSYNLALDKDKTHLISIGAQAGFIQKSVDFTKLFFDNQYNLSDGGGFDPAISNDEAFTNTKVMLPDLGGGIMYFMANRKSRVNPFAGISIFHLNEPNETFISQESKLPKRSVFHAGAKVNLNANFQVTPQVLLMKQLNNYNVQSDLILHYNFTASDKYVLLGSSYRNKDAMIIHTGLKLGRFTYRLSYDANTSTLKPYSNGRGGYELSITYVVDKEPIVKQPKQVPCLRF